MLQTVREICITSTLLFSVFSSCWCDSGSENDTVCTKQFFGLKMCLSKCAVKHIFKRHLQKKEVSEFSPCLVNKLHYTLRIITLTNERF